MSCVNVVNVAVLDNPARFDNPFQFEVTFEILSPITDDLEWKLIYVGSAESEEHDQEIDSVLVAPQGVGPYKFVFQGDPPNARDIPTQDLLGVTVILLSCHYHDKEFIRIGYYVNTEYDTPELNDAPPEQPLYERLVRNILAEKPRVTRYQIDWSDHDATLQDAALSNGRSEMADEPRGGLAAASMEAPSPMEAM